MAQRRILKIFLLLIIILFLLLVGALFYRFPKRFVPASLPPAVPYNSASTPQTQDLSPAASDPIFPAEVNLEIPFAPQAPHQNWSLPYQQFCEEASVLMAASYINGQPVKDTNDANQKLLAIMDFEIKRFGFYEDTNAEETAVILREFYALDKIEVVPDPSIQNIKSALAEGKAVIVPAAGRQLGNPYYQQPGPLYHMLVIKGYRKNGDFITNDPGTRRGADYIYKADVIMNAIHDWNAGDVDTGRKIMIVAG